MTDSIDPSNRNHSDLVDFLESRLGENFRSLVEYDPDQEKIHYLRDEISEEAALSRLERVRTLYEGERSARFPDEADPEFGPLYASTYIFGGAIVVHIMDGSGSVVGFSMDHQVGGRLSKFVRECMEVLYESSPWNRGTQTSG